MVVKLLKGFDRLMERGCVAILVLLISVMTAVVVAGIFWRYVLNAPLSWSEEVARYSMIWASFIGGALAFRRGGHIAIGFVVDAMPMMLRRAILLSGSLLVLGFLVLLLWYGWTLLEQVRFQRSPGLRISMMYAYAAVPVGAALMLYHMLAAAVEMIWSDGKETSSGASAPVTGLG